MRLLFIHSSPFYFRVTEKTRFAEPLTDEVLGEGHAENALVVMCAAEAPDEAAMERVVATAALEIERTADNVHAETIALYPYSHLSNNLSTPQGGLAMVRKLRAALSHRAVINVPYGWYKAFKINGLGHPVSELSRVIEIEPGEITRTMGRGREHPVAALNEEFRQIFLDLGIDETINPAIVEDHHIYRQYGPEAPLILDRVFYLAGLDRADIGLSKTKEQQILDIIPDFDRFDALKGLLRQYKEAQIEADDFLEEFALQLKITGEQAAQILQDVFPEFRELKAVPTNKTLRSHMTSNWFPLLGDVRNRLPLPVRLFSVGSRFRREQRQDAHHLFESTSASVVVMDKDLDMSHGQELTREILKRLGFKKSSFVRKKIASRYYDPETDTEVFIKYQGQNIEVGNLGFYAPAALANYNIDLPVFNIGFGVERIAMIRSGAQDLRSLVYPLTYEEVTFDDRELAALLGPSRAPEDAALRSAVAGMAAVAVEQRDAVGPAERVLYSGPIGARNADIVLFNWDQGKPLLSLAALNEIYVHDGNIYGLPRDSAALGDKYLPIYEQGINTGLRFIDLILAGFAAEAEKMARRNPPEPVEERWKIAKRPIQVNLEVPEAAYDYIQRLHKNIKVSGPLFFGLKVVWK